METIPTAEILLSNKFSEVKGSLSILDMQGLMIQFAKLHVEAALKAASDKAQWDKETRESWFGDMSRVNGDYDFESTDGDGVPYELHKVVINKNSILNSYPLENIE